MSVGHLARLLETEGIATVIIAARSFELPLESMMVPRALLTPYPMGRPVGAPGDPTRQEGVLRGALRLLEKAKAPGTIVHFEAPYRSEWDS